LTYLNLERLNQIDPKMFKAQKPYPWINPEGLLTDEGYQRLQGTLPDVSLFERRFDAQRKYGQKSHDRYTLEWRTNPPVAPPWKEFVAELEGQIWGLTESLRPIRCRIGERRRAGHHVGDQPPGDRPERQPPMPVAEREPEAVLPRRAAEHGERVRHVGTAAEPRLRLVRLAEWKQLLGVRH